MNKLESLKSARIGQSAAKLRTGERSQTIPKGSRAYVNIGSKWEDLGYIYLLIDPVGGEVRYVGSTTRPVFMRLAEHFRLREDTKNFDLQEWLRTSDYPIVKIISYPKHLLHKAEKYWIKYYSKDNRLFNMDYMGTAKYGFTKVSEKLNPTKMKPCCKVSCDTGEIITCYKSIAEASMSTGAHMGNIMHVISGKRKTTAGSCWIPK